MRRLFMKTKMAVALAATLALVMSCLLADAAYADDRGRRGDNDGLALGLGAGIVSPDGDGEIYWTANLRIPINRNRGAKGKDGKRRHRSQSGGIKAYIEPEIGYWERSDDVIDTTDLSLGVNLVGVVPGRTVDYFFGVGFGIHSFDNEINDPDFPSLDDDDTRLGGNFHVGLDVNISDSVALFGVGRLDLLEGGEFDDTQSKVYGGLRFRF